MPEERALRLPGAARGGDHHARLLGAARRARVCSARHRDLARAADAGADERLAVAGELDFAGGSELQALPHLETRDQGERRGDGVLAGEGDAVVAADPGGVERADDRRAMLGGVAIRHRAGAVGHPAVARATLVEQTHHHARTAHSQDPRRASIHYRRAGSRPIGNARCPRVLRLK